MNKHFNEGQLADIAIPNAAIGFAIASHYLYLTEGQRKITIRLAAGSDNAKLYNQKLDCYLTTEKEWLAVPMTAITAGTMAGAVACAEFTITLTGDIPAITDYVAAVHGGTYNVALPMLKLILTNTDEEAYQYETLKDIKITALEIKVDVGDISGVGQTG